MDDILTVVYTVISCFDITLSYPKQVTAVTTQLESTISIRRLFPAHPHYRRGHWPLIHSVSFYSEANIIASARTASGVFIISRKTGAVLWHLAAPIVCQQHRAHQINAAGDILIPDNGVFRPEISVPFSQAIIVSLDKQIR